MTTVLQFDIQTTEQQHKLQQVIEFVSNLKLPFRKVEPTESDDLETVTIRERLTEKYVKTGEWASMDEEQREDAAFVEMMLYSKEDPDNAYYSEEESNAILADLKNEHYATHH